MQHVLARALAVAALLFPMSGAELAAGNAICYRTDAAPFSYKTEDGTAAGYSLEICRRVIAENGGDSPKLVEVTAEDRFEVLKSGGCDMLCEATTMTMERRRNGIEYSLITFLTGSALLLPKAVLNNDGYSDTVTVGFLEGSTIYERWEDGEIVGGTGVPFEFVPQPSHEAATDALSGGTLDAYIADREMIEEILSTRGDLRDSHVLGQGSLSYEPYAIAVRLGDDDLRIRIDDVLAELFRSGEIFELIAAHVPNRLHDSRLKDLFLIQSLPE